ncbi:MAG TPA: PPC domain-containing DNA-binding protein [Patescibacteria group bacterium]|nr:PPC domain-containing DNA-binding protein [Patescibacteria group bacterium]
MKTIVADGRRFVLRFDKGEDVIAGLIQFMKDQGIGACAFNGIGSAAELELGYFNSHIKDYRRKPFFEELEVISFIGSGALKDSEPIIHAHGMFGRTDFSVFGGHVFKLGVSATCEIFLIKLDAPMTRALNPDFNLNLLA